MSLLTCNACGARENEWHRSDCTAQNHYANKPPEYVNYGEPSRGQVRYFNGMVSFDHGVTWRHRDPEYRTLMREVHGKRSCTHPPGCTRCSWCGFGYPTVHLEYGFATPPPPAPREWVNVGDGSGYLTVKLPQTYAEWRKGVAWPMPKKLRTIEVNIVGNVESLREAWSKAYGGPKRKPWYRRLFGRGHA